MFRFFPAARAPRHPPPFQGGGEVDEVGLPSPSLFGMTRFDEVDEVPISIGIRCLYLGQP